MDVGGEYQHYSADYCRTFPVSGKFTQRQREIYEVVLGAQLAVEASFKPGVTTWKDLNETAKSYFKNSPVKDSKDGSLDTHFYHGIGHFVGLNVHDLGDYASPIPRGAVFNIEPGLYLDDEGFGVRLEDSYFVTEKGLTRLTTNVPREAAAVERLVGAAKSSQTRSTHPAGLLAAFAPAAAAPGRRH